LTVPVRRPWATATLPCSLAMATAAAAAVTANIIENRLIATTLLFASAVMFGILGVVSILSIGIGFLVAAVLAAVGASRLSPTSVA